MRFSLLSSLALIAACGTSHTPDASTEDGGRRDAGAVPRDADVRRDAPTGVDGPPIPDVVILDNRMPGLSGLEVAEQILAERPGQIIVLYSAFLDDEVRAQAEQVGIARCVSKEDLESLPHVIQELTAA